MTVCPVHIRSRLLRDEPHAEKDFGLTRSTAMNAEKSPAKSVPDRELREDELELVNGGIFQALSSAISEVMKNFGGALNTAARGG